MSAQCYIDLIRHHGHNIEIATYGPKDEPLNVAVECTDCNEVLMDFDRYSEDPDENYSPHKNSR